MMRVTISLTEEAIENLFLRKEVDHSFYLQMSDYMFTLRHGMLI